MRDILQIANVKDLLKVNFVSVWNLQIKSVWTSLQTT